MDECSHWAVELRPPHTRASFIAALEQLQQRMTDLYVLGIESPEFMQWHHDVVALLIGALGKDALQLWLFSNISYTPFICSSSDEKMKHHAFMVGLSNARVLLQAIQTDVAFYFS